MMLQSKQNGFTHKGDKHLAGKTSIMVCRHTGVSEIFFSTPCPQGYKGPPILASWQVECFIWEKGLDSENYH
jgi:hypothetical protein